MIPVDQTRTTGPGGGNCLAACIASILECSIEDVDSIDLAGGGERSQWEAMAAVLVPRGYQPFSYAPGGELFPQIAPPGYHIACSASHATVAFNGRVVHDPHPRKRGLADITEWILLLPIAGSAAAYDVVLEAAHLAEVAEALTRAARDFMGAHGALRVLYMAHHVDLSSPIPQPEDHNGMMNPTELFEALAGNHGPQMAGAWLYREILAGRVTIVRRNPDYRPAPPLGPIVKMKD